MKKSPARVTTQAESISTNVTAKTCPTRPGISSRYLNTKGKKLNQAVLAINDAIGVR